MAPNTSIAFAIDVLADAMYSLRNVFAENNAKSYFYEFNVDRTERKRSPSAAAKSIHSTPHRP